MQNPNCPASVESDLAEAKLALQLMDELFSIEKQEHINPTVRIASGLGLEIGRGSLTQIVLPEGNDIFRAT
jgi:hypothetical protein